MTTISEYVGELVVLRCWCGIQHAVPEALRDQQMREFDAGRRARSIFCPLGHAYVPKGEPQNARLERQLAAERASHDQTKAELREKERQIIAEKRAKTKLKNRIANGVCPCCHRTFKQLAAHMANKHPDYSATSASG